MPDDYDSPKKSTSQPSSARPSIDVAKPSPVTADIPASIPEEPSKEAPAEQPAKAALSTQETTIAIELGFAALTALYKLSSAWGLRLAILSAAKTILLRPGNQSLSSLRSLLQDSLDSNGCDAGVAAHIRQLRANSLPTEEERAAWPKARSAEERELLRQKARRLLIERGMPAAVNGVVGKEAGAEARGRVFDALQVGKVGRGVVLGVGLQALRAVIQ